jgi:hypothetical protein
VKAIIITAAGIGSGAAAVLLRIGSTGVPSEIALADPNRPVMKFRKIQR